MTPVESIPTGNSMETHLKMMTLPYQTSPEMAFILICRENKKKYIENLLIDIQYIIYGSPDRLCLQYFRSKSASESFSSLCRRLKLRPFGSFWVSWSPAQSFIPLLKPAGDGNCHLRNCFRFYCHSLDYHQVYQSQNLAPESNFNI